jgi:hypothetical protein
VRGHLRTLFFATAAIGAAVVLFVGLTLPPAARSLGGTLPPNLVTGAYHIHTLRSDGTGSVNDIAAAASRAGLAFIILTDHGDATRAPDAPAYRHGVLCIDAVEINTAAGHVVALGLDRAAPYPLAGTAADVIEDVHRLGGVAIAAHPDSPKESLRWRSSSSAPFDGIEWLNADSVWRHATARHPPATAARSLFRGPESIATLFAMPVRTLDRWDRAAHARPVFGLAALDAHANIAWRENDEPRQHTALARPSYQSMFETLAQTVVLDAPLSGDAARDAPRIVDAISRGRSFSIVRAFAAPAALEFRAEQGGREFGMGERLPASGETTFRAAVANAPDARVALMQNGRMIANAAGALRHVVRAADGVYRIEVRLPGHPMPWLMSNPITVGVPAAPAKAAAPGEPPDEPSEWIDLRNLDHPWAVEHDPSSTGAIALDGDELRFAFHLGGGTPSGQFAALAGQVGQDRGVDRVTFTARADRPMRVSLQVRIARDANARWRHSVYLDTVLRSVTVSLQDFEPADAPTTRRPIVTPLQSVLFVVDTLNSKTGSTGTIWVRGVSLGVREP